MAVAAAAATAENYCEEIKSRLCLRSASASLRALNKNIRVGTKSQSCE